MFYVLSFRQVDLCLVNNIVQAYQDILKHLGLKDDRVRRPHLRRLVLLKRFIVRLAGSVFLFGIALPGFGLWLPVFATAALFSWRCRTRGRIEDGEVLIPINARTC